MTSLRVGNARFTYEEEGAGVPLVYVHGSVSDLRTWSGQRAPFAERFRVVAYSRRYHWPNDPIAEGADYAMADHVADLRALLHAWEATPAHLVGHSYGGFVILLLALEAPALVRSLTLAEPPVLTLFTSSTPTPRELLAVLASRPRTGLALLRLGALGMAPATAAMARGDLDRAVRRFGRAALGRAAYRRLSDDRQRQVRQNLIPAEFLGSGFPPLSAERLQGLRTPTLLLNAQSSPRAFHRLTDRLEEVLPQSERVEIPDASHILHEDNAPAFNAALLTFLMRLGRGADPTSA